MPGRDDDPRKCDAKVVIRDFPGFVPNADPHDIRPGVAAACVNATSTRPGELRPRLGYRVVRFD